MTPRPPKKPMSDARIDYINRSVIKDQVEMVVAVRMACMDLLARNLRAKRGMKAVGVMV